MSYHAENSAKDEAITIWKAGVAAVDGTELVRNFVRVSKNGLIFGNLEIPLDSFSRLVVVGAGKASGWMAQGLEQALGSKILQQKSVSGRVNVPDDQVAQTQTIEVVGCRPAGINLPTDRVIDSTSRILDLVGECDPDDLCICLISGGASALLERPMTAVSLQDLRSVSSLLSSAAAPIEELNAVRRQISQVKAGGLARAANCRRLISLIISDVLGDRLEMIGSGPTVLETEQAAVHRPTETAIQILQRRTSGDLSQVPQSVIQTLNNETQKSAPKQPVAEPVHFVIGNNRTAVQAATAKAAELGFDCSSETHLSEETAEQSANRIVDRLLESCQFETGRKRCFVTGGEPTVSLSENPGKGGRNQHLVLSAMMRLLSRSGRERLESAFPGCLDRGNIGLLSGGTDGEDGNVSVAGAAFDLATIRGLQQANDPKLLDRIESALEKHDSFSILQELQCLLTVPPTRTNVCDLRIVLWSPNPSVRNPDSQAPR